ncbi:hypothetical protein, partial [Rhodoblastus sp.]|uniref:hypothetical protein n=1 Tax=Rhodoblastus sp. TaxID=1962975 RepID=UPI003F9595A4
MKTPTGSGASVGRRGLLTGRPSTVAYNTWMPVGMGGEIGGASATMNFPALRAGPPDMPAELSSLATTGVAPLRIEVQFCPPLMDLNTPTPETPAYRMRAAAGEVRSMTRERT